MKKGLQALWLLPLGLAGSAIVGTVASPFGAIATAPTLGCQTHRCDPEFVCINRAGAFKFVSDPSDCTPEGGDDGLPGYTPIPGYNTVVNTDGNTLTWTTASLDGPWLDFPGNRTYIIDIPPPLAGHSFFTQECVSADNPVDADASHANYICGPAYLAELSNDPGYQHISVNNAACALYSLRLELQAIVPMDTAPPVDAGDSTDLDTGSLGDADAGSAD